jgi:hypothetical protein
MRRSFDVISDDYRIAGALIYGASRIGETLQPALENCAPLELGRMKNAGDGI